MCGVHFISQAPGQDGDAMERMNAMQMATAYRGPDERAFLPVERDVLGHNRLSLRGGDLGKQPYVVKGLGVLAYNGQLFGEDTEPSDTERLARAFARGDSGFAHAHNGMAAYIWNDARQDTYTLGRDAFGIKPLWYQAKDSGFTASSEVRGILAADGQLLEKDTHLAMAEYLRYRCVAGQAGLFTTICNVPLGAEIRWDSSKMHLHLQRPPYAQLEAAASDTSLRPLKELLDESIRQNLTADRPVGLMLSAGIDSGLLAYMTAEMGQKLPCFTTEGPEAAAAKSLAEKLGHSWHRVDVPRGTDDWLAFLRHSPYPVADPGAYMTWCTAKTAKAAGVPVLLSGAGADEVFLGYRRHAWWHRYGTYAGSPIGRLAAPLLHTWDNRLPPTGKGHTPSALYRRWMASPSNLADFLGLEEAAFVPPLAQLPDALWLDLVTYLPNQVLYATDLYSMAHSVEVRVPYLTRDLLHWAWALGKDALLKKGPKTPLKALFADYGGQLLPKTGFGPTASQYPNFYEIEEALGLERATHPVYAALPFARVQQWRKRKTPLQARMAFWCVGMQMEV